MVRTTATAHSLPLLVLLQLQRQLAIRLQGADVVLVLVQQVLHFLAIHLQGWAGVVGVVTATTTTPCEHGPGNT